MEIEKAEAILDTYMDHMRADPCDTTYLSPTECEAFLAVIRANDEKLADLLNDENY